MNNSGASTRTKLYHSVKRIFEKGGASTRNVIRNGESVSDVPTFISQFVKQVASFERELITSNWKLHNNSQ